MNRRDHAEKTKSRRTNEIKRKQWKKQPVTTTIQGIIGEKEQPQLERHQNINPTNKIQKKESGRSKNK